MKNISVDSLLKIRYFKKFNVINKITESAHTIKKRIDGTVNDIKYVIENWNGISSSPDEVVCQVINKLEKFNENERISIINCMDRTILPFVSEECINNIIEEQSKVDDVNFYLLEDLNRYKLYNRISSNYTKLDNTLQISKIIRESGFNKFLDNDDYKESVITNLTGSIYETYKINDLYKFNITLESLLFGFRSNGISVDETFLMKVVSEYYVNNSSLESKEIKNVISEINLYSDLSKNNVLVLFEDSKQTSINGVTKQHTQVKDICDSFKLQDKSVDKLRSTLNKIYTRSLDECITDSPSVLSIITTSVTSLGIGMINPILGILSAFVQYIISKNANVKQSAEYISALKDEKRKIEKKIEKQETPELKAYLEKLDASIEKVEDYRRSLLTDEEVDKEYEDNFDDDFLESNNITIRYSLLSCISEAFDSGDYDTLNIISTVLTENNIYDLLSESGDLMNTVKLVKEKLKNAASKLGTKEKAMCNKIDTRFDLFVRDFQRAMSLEKRENVIKGKVVPSLSNMIKIATVGTIGAIVAPAITGIALVAGYAVSKRATIKEKQYILDELDVQLKIIDRKIQQAEIKNDDKALEELYRLQARLTKETKRIKYNIRLYHESGCVL